MKCNKFGFHTKKGHKKQKKDKKKKKGFLTCS